MNAGPELDPRVERARRVIAEAAIAEMAEGPTLVDAVLGRA